MRSSAPYRKVTRTGLAPNGVTLHLECGHKEFRETPIHSGKYEQERNRKSALCWTCYDDELRRSHGR